MRFFIFHFIFFFYFNWPLPPRTSETKNDWKVSTSEFSEIKRDFTRFLSSHVLKFFQNSKLSSFFVVKMKKIIISRKKNESLNFAKSNAHRKTNAGGSFETQNFFFFFFSLCDYTCKKLRVVALSLTVIMKDKKVHYFSLWRYVYRSVYSLRLENERWYFLFCPPLMVS